MGKYVVVFVSIMAAFLFAPALYLASLALLLSAHVHDWRFVSRALVKNYAVPSNALVKLPIVGPPCSNYFQFCVRITRADQEHIEKP
jgi:hypothetical protein